MRTHKKRLRGHNRATVRIVYPDGMGGVRVARVDREKYEAGKPEKREVEGERSEKKGV